MIDPIENLDFADIQELYLDLKDLNNILLEPAQAQIEQSFENLDLYYDQLSYKNIENNLSSEFEHIPLEINLLAPKTVKIDQEISFQINICKEYIKPITTTPNPNSNENPKPIEYLLTGIDPVTKLRVQWKSKDKNSKHPDTVSYDYISVTLIKKI